MFCFVCFLVPFTEPFRHTTYNMTCDAAVRFQGEKREGGEDPRNHSCGIGACVMTGSGKIRPSYRMCI
jgi:hypothetical protein